MSDAQEISPFTIAEVILDDALNKPLDYRIPESLVGRVMTGSRVNVPVRNSQRQGTVVGLKEKSAFAKLRQIAGVISEKTHVTDELFRLAEWISYYYCTPLRKVLKTVLPSSVRGKSKAKEQLLIKPDVSLNQLAVICDELRKSHPTQALALDAVLKSPKGILLSKLLEMAGVSRSPIETLIKKKVLLCQKVQIDRSILSEEEYFPTKPKKLNEEQSQTLEKIKESLDKDRFEVRLVHGVTGSGKTEVYLQAIEHALLLKKGVLFLVPEIALTSQMIERLKSRFQEKIAILHHRLSQGERFDAWHQIREGKALIAIGARSAVFSPIQNLGLIIVDEEHESSYKQTDEAPSYHARDVAVMRGKIANATVILGSATPSCESYYNAKIGKYQLSVLTNRADSATLPQVTVVDMKEEIAKNKGFTLFSNALLNAIKQRVEIGEQVILFLNRRGYHTAQMCTSCAHVLQCPHCDVNLTFHLGDNVLACHLCDYRLSPPPRQCPGCKAEGSLKFKGAGTEMVERALHAVLPEVRTLRLDADTTRHKGSHELLFKSFRAGKADVLIGTQMIAKGLHFPQVTLVGVLNADGSLQIPDFRASETVFQLLTQVAGRSGRGALSGEVIIQTHLPDHLVIGLAKEQNYEGFFNQEIAVRQLFHYPPFTHLVKLTFSGKDPRLVQERAAALRSHLIGQLPAHFEILPVVPCGHAKVKGDYRFQFIIKAEKMGQLLSLLQGQGVREENFRLFIDVDPLSTFF
ncbi:MAG: primosomal protein N' [Verrucomicrobia bacterium]|nr:primosomal protein N' [Verrucomicrobiota bacterium]